MLVRYLFNGTDGQDLTLANSGADLISTSAGNGSYIRFATSMGAHGTTGVRLNTMSTSFSCTAQFPLNATSSRMQATLLFTSPAATPSGALTIIALRHASGRAGAVQWNVAGQLNFIDGSNTITTIAPASAVQLGTQYRLSIDATGASTTNGTLDIKLYTPTGTTALRTVTVTNANLSANEFTGIRLGDGGVTGDVGYEDLQLNDGEGAEIVAYSPAVALNPLNDSTVEPGTVVTLSAVLTEGGAADSYSWRVVSGTSVTLTGYGASRTFIAPSVMPPSGTAVIIGVTATKNGSTSQEVTATVTVPPQIRWTYHNGAWVGKRLEIGL
jgi:hypothetical protein